MSQFSSFLRSVKKLFDAAVERMDLSPGIAELLSECRSVYQICFQAAKKGFRDSVIITIATSTHAD